MATMSAMMASNAVCGGLRSLQAAASVRKTSFGGNALSSGFASASGSRIRRGLTVRSEGVRESVDKATKKEISREEILRNQAENESEKKSVLGTEPTSSGSFYPRPEVERRPETGSKDLGSIFAFDGAVPETVNGRLAMVGLVWALVAEKMSGLTVFEQLYTPAGGFGLVFYVAVVQLITFASVIPILNGESTDARSFGPFRAQAERWNGRLAMLGFLSLLLTEQFIKAPVFGNWF